MYLHWGSCSHKQCYIFTERVDDVCRRCLKAPTCRVCIHCRPCSQQPFPFTQPKAKAMPKPKPTPQVAHDELRYESRSSLWLCRHQADNCTSTYLSMTPKLRRILDRDDASDNRAPRSTHALTPSSKASRCTGKSRPTSFMSPFTLDSTPRDLRGT